MPAPPPVVSDRRIGLARRNVASPGFCEVFRLSAGIGWQVPRLPGLGEVRWDRFVSALYKAGYDYAIVVEHEDRQFEGSDEKVKAGFLLARNAVAPYIV